MTDKELKKFALKFRRGILGSGSSRMMCAAVCFPLVTLLNMSGVKCELVESDLGDCNHVWLRLADGRALDPTADQFNWLFPELKMPLVYLGPPTQIHADSIEATQPVAHGKTAEQAKEGEALRETAR